MSLPLNKKFDELLKRKPISMHVPGHKNMTIGYLNKMNFEMDMTEITGLDDLHHAEDVIAQSMSNVKKHPDYDAYYLVNGTTSGILSVIQGFSNVQGEYVIARNAHKSVFHALDLVHASCRLLGMDMSIKTKQYLGPSLNGLLQQLKDSKLLVLTYPNYYGECFDIEETLKYTKIHQTPTLIDEAHGAHFDLAGFPKSSLSMGADYVVQSYHKTLPSLTMSSIIFIHKNAPQREKVLKYLAYFQSSSPSYLLMNSLELAHDFYEKYDSNLFFEKRRKCIQAIESIGMRIVEVNDPLKLNIQCTGYSGIELQQLFENKDIYVELADEYQVLFVLPLWHKGDYYPFQELIDRIKQIEVEKRSNNIDYKIPDYELCGLYQPVEISKVKSIDINEAENQILAVNIVPYPPGIPIMLKGELITKNMIKLMNYWCEQHIRVEGIKKHKIEIKDE
ncbi:Orn/Lys/Arg family decarboxylase [Staphylococcus shinii]|uniref:Orn/Lys/Arg family decarboxylase n=1 Tax=Staphylococcus shinii TaxID=2912228 RepID=UPI000D1EC0A3|nr:lysine decarboxylase [Staphylococcus shinii]PTI67752.1 lysine decarboxylase [Staphylococcus shinii]